MELAQLREQPIGKVAADLGISESCLRHWGRLAEGDGSARSGVRAGQDTVITEHQCRGRGLLPGGWGRLQPRGGGLVDR